MSEEEDILLPDQASSPETVVSVTHGPDARFRHDDSPLQLGRTDPFLRLALVNVYVRDQDRSLRFFLDQLGFSLQADVRFASGDRWIAVSPPDGTASVSLRLAKPGSEDGRLVGLAGLIAFITEDVEAKYKEWSERGVKFTLAPQTQAWGRVFCRFEDPDGNSFELAGVDWATRAIEERRRALAARWRRSIVPSKN